MKFLPLAILLFAMPAEARDWFVRAGAGASADGSQAQPFNDPWQALAKCEAGDKIHVAEGKYFGQAGLGQWKIPFDNVTMLGGYNAQFTERNPWVHHSELLWDKKSKNWPKEERVSSTALNNTFDGFVLDQQDQCEYIDDAKSGRREKACEGPLRFALPATIKNNIIINPGASGIVACAGSTIENNLIVNSVLWGIVVNMHAAHKAPATIKNNTVLFSWTFSKPGLGKYDGSGIELKTHANVTQNILAHMDNNGIHSVYETEKTSITKNVFFMNLYSNVKHQKDAKDAVADDKSMDLLDEMGFKDVSGNEVKDPGLAFDPKWLDKYSLRTAPIAGKVDMNDWNKARQALGLPLIGKGYKSPEGVAPPYSLAAAAKLLNPKVSQGAHVVALPVQFAAATAAAPARDYKKVELASWAKNPSDDQAFEMTVAVGGVANISGIPAQFDVKGHEGVTLYGADGNDRVTGFYKKGSAVARAVSSATGHYSGSGKPDRLYTVRGISYVVKNLPKGGIFIDSLEEAAGASPAQATPLANRPVGRDWFVRAGATSGDGSKDKPFKDPYQALEKVEAGDSIHVTEGEYNGKLKAGAWKIATPYVALIGGYDKDFKTRNPWKHPSVLRTSSDLKTYNSDYIIQGDNDHTGAIVDGFLFDKTPNNKYKADGDLDYSNMPKMDHIWFAKPGCIIRNSVFVNGPERSIRANGGQTIENNIFMNSHMRAVTVDAGFGGLVTIRDNTFAFAWYYKFGKGLGTIGSHLTLGGRVQAVVDNNIFEFSDNDAIVLNTNASDVVLTRNTFSHNLWSHVQKSDGWVTFDDKNFNQLSDLGWKKIEGNQVITAGLPINKKWLDTYLNRTAYVPGKVKMDDWNSFREIIGQPMIATGGKVSSGLAPNYPYMEALTLFPKNSKVTAGARAKDLPVSFNGSAPKAEEAHDYAETTWAASALNADAWAKLDGKRVVMKIVIRDPDNQYKLGDLKKEEWAAYTVCGPEGIDSGGLPMRVYVKKGTKQERVMQNAKSYSSGEPSQTYLLRGIARENRQFAVESAERAD